MKVKHFIRKIEDFVCENCGEKVIGTGYTNHCPKCLFSKHVDEKTPGDRKSGCKGLMQSISIEQKQREFVLIHKCLKCGKITKNKTSPNDSFEKLIELSKISNQ